MVQFSRPGIMGLKSFAIAAIAAVWILATGIWNDAGVWDDAETWNDS